MDERARRSMTAEMVQDVLNDIARGLPSHVIAVSITQDGSTYEGIVVGIGFLNSDGGPTYTDITLEMGEGLGKNRVTLNRLNDPPPTHVEITYSRKRILPRKN